MSHVMASLTWTSAGRRDGGVPCPANQVDGLGCEDVLPMFSIMLSSWLAFLKSRDLCELDGVMTSGPCGRKIE